MTNRRIQETDHGTHPPAHPDLYPASPTTTAPSGVSQPGSQHSGGVKLKSGKDLEELRNASMIHQKAKAIYMTISVGTCALARGAAKVADEIERELRQRHLDNLVGLRRTGCQGLCEMEPIVVVYPQGLVYGHVTPADVPEIISESVLGRPPETHIGGRNCVLEKDIPFFQGQSRVILSSHKYIDPQSIDDYIAGGGYSALSRALLEMQPEEVIAEIDRSGLRSLGATGLPVSQKWSACRTRTRYNETTWVVCNANEGDPGGAQVAQALLEGNPHGIIEGMTIAAFAIGSGSGHVYVRGNYSLAAKNLAIALGQARECGMLGKDILGAGFDFDITFSSETSAFACEGSGESRIQPSGPYDDADLSYDFPVLSDSVETWANIPLVIGRGRRWQPETGKGKRKGTKILSLVGATGNTGLVEVPIGTSLREIICDIGGGVRNGKALKAVHVGGPSGGFIPPSRLDAKVDFEDLAKAGASMGSGSIVVLDERSCIVEMARYFTRFLAENLCGKCPSCHTGLGNMANVLDRITTGYGKEDDIVLLEQLAMGIRTGSLCNTGANAANAVLSSIRYFREEYEAHISDGRCPSGTCKSLMALQIDAARCSGCGECAEECPEGAIKGRDGHPHSIDQRLCIKCRICEEVCQCGAVVVSPAPVAADFRSRFASVLE